jgi:hypothetical protein
MEAEKATATATAGPKTAAAIASLRRVSVSATEARGRFADLLDDARKRPQFVRRRRQSFVLMPVDDMTRLPPYKIHLRVVHEDGIYVTENDEIDDVIGWGDTREEAIDGFLEDLVMFSYMYYDHFDEFITAPNRVGQWPIVLKVISLLDGGLSPADIVEIED